MNIMTIRQTADRYPAFTEGSLRWLVFNKDRNGFSTCVRKIGRRVLIDEQAFVAWIDSGASVKEA